MSLKTALSVSACKASCSLLRKMKKGGTTTPGKIAMKINPTVLKELAKGMKVTVVTGTNGKTTTARMIDEAMEKAGLRYFANRSGANLLPGIVTVFSENASFTGKRKHTHALIECDEAAFRVVSKYLNPQCIVVTNVFRDQQDRFGDVNNTIDLITAGIKNSPNAVVCLNADCSLTASIAERVDNKIVYFGVDTPIYENAKTEVSEAPYCIHCNHEYKYDYVTYGHLGGFYCEHCGYRRHDTAVSAAAVLNSDMDHSDIKLKIFKNTLDCRINLPGGYNIYNAVSAAAACKVMGIPDKVTVDALGSFSCGFGRMEKVSVNGTDIRMILVKNPTGCNQALNFVTNVQEPTTLVFSLNDREGDGTDISWIWDTDYEKINSMGDKLKKIYVCGSRVDDMAVRLKYAGIPEDRIIRETDYDRLFQRLVVEKGNVCILPTYSAMLDMRAKMSKLTNIKDIWE